MNMPPKKTFKIVIVGDVNVGKSCFFYTKALQQFPQVYIPTVFENHTTTVEYHGESYELGLWDTAGNVQHFL